MIPITIYKIEGGEPLILNLDSDYKVKTIDIKEYISDFFGIDSVEVSLFIRFSKNNLLLEKTDGYYLQGLENKYLFSTNPNYKPDFADTLAINDSLEYLILDNSKVIPNVKTKQNNLKNPIFSSRRIRK